jgi:hypothetical protein
MILLVSNASDSPGPSIPWALSFYFILASVLGLSVGLLRPWVKTLPVLLLLGIGTAMTSFYLYAATEMGFNIGDWEPDAPLWIFGLGAFLGVLYGLVAWWRHSLDD